MYISFWGLLAIFCLGLLAYSNCAKQKELDTLKQVVEELASKLAGLQTDLLGVDSELDELRNEIAD